MNKKFKIDDSGLKFVKRCAEILKNQDEVLFEADDDLETTKSILDNALDQLNLDDLDPKQVSMAFKLYYLNLEYPLLTEDFLNDFTAVARMFK